MTQSSIIKHFRTAQIGIVFWWVRFGNSKFVMNKKRDHNCVILRFDAFNRQPSSIVFGLIEFSQKRINSIQFPIYVQLVMTHSESNAYTGHMAHKALFYQYFPFSFRFGIFIIHHDSDCACFRCVLLFCPFFYLSLPLSLALSLTLFLFLLCIHIGIWATVRMTHKHFANSFNSF